VVASAVESGCAAIACTYTEPTIWYEYAREIVTLGRERSLRSVFVTNGFIEEAPLRAIAPVLDAANIDLKGFTEEFYRSVCGARLQPVLDTIRLCRELGVWVEVTTLVIPGLNDADEELRGIARFIASVGREIPWHLSRFHPDYRMTDREATPLTTLRRAGEIGRAEGLHHVYLGNIAGEGEETRCHSCGTPVIRRHGFTVVENLVTRGRCPNCAAEQHGVFA
jgi:pyruvate formate lyase activating enzyme